MWFNEEKKVFFCLQDGLIRPDSWIHPSCQRLFLILRLLM